MRGPLTEAELKAVSDSSLLVTGDLGLRHAAENLPLIQKTIHDVRDTHPGDWTLVVSAGPSLHRHHQAPTILASGFTGAIITVDAALGYCLRNGLVPHYVLCVDPHPEYVIRWFGDPELHRRRDTDYFRRTELDPALHTDEVAKNTEQVRLVNQHGPRMKAILGTSVAHNVARRVLDAGMDLYWWNPLYDDWEAPNSYTRRAWEMNRVPCMVGGGNVGTAAWVFAHAILRKQHVGMVGMDFGYPPGTHVFNTQRYYELRDFFGEERAADGLIAIPNPHLGEAWLTDPTYDWYRQTFREMVKIAACRTYNCTEGGVIFGEGIHWTTLKDFLALWKAQDAAGAQGGTHG